MIKVMGRDNFLQEIKNYIPEQPACIEIGVLNGEFSSQIYSILKPSKLFLVDPWKTVDEHQNKNLFKYKKLNYGKQLNYLPVSYSCDSSYNHVLELFKKEIAEEKVSLIRDFSYNAYSLFEDNFFDFVYIDACHMYECVRDDLFYFKSKLKSGGILCGHDYVECEDFGVIQAVDEFCEKYNYEMVVYNDTGIGGGDWALRPK